MTSVRSFALFLFVASVVASTAIAQPIAAPAGDRVIVDGVAAVVGNDVILMSDVLQRAMVLSQQQRGTDARNPEFQREVLNSLIDNKLVLSRAREDSLVVREEEVT
ncbi:MAG: SurA N-terminal domain-containing protein, partial [bacterium]|nr:SurA N-terminal domain-containing protein [Candidatus Kapabacteria bacterium]